MVCDTGRLSIIAYVRKNICRCVIIRHVWLKQLTDRDIKMVTTATSFPYLQCSWYVHMKLPSTSFVSACCHQIRKVNLFIIPYLSVREELCNLMLSKLIFPLACSVSTFGSNLTAHAQAVDHRPHWHACSLYEPASGLLRQLRNNRCCVDPTVRHSNSRIQLNSRSDSWVSWLLQPAHVSKLYVNECLSCSHFACFYCPVRRSNHVKNAMQLNSHSGNRNIFCAWYFYIPFVSCSWMNRAL
jgi:hypothetical protein